MSSSIGQVWGNDADLAPGFSYVKTGDGPMDFDCVFTGYDPKVEREMLEYAERRHALTEAHLNDPLNKDELARQKELSAEMSKSAYWVKQEELAMHPSRMGKVLLASEFITTLQTKCKLNAWYNDATIGTTGLLSLVIAKDGHAKAVCGVQPGAMPEYSVMYFDDHGAPTKERYRGWRTVLLKLILLGVLSEKQVNEVFGVPSGPAARRYLETLWGIRNQK